jgi:hypothetical protein
MTFTPSARLAFAQPFPEQLAFFQKKVALPTGAWDDLKKAQHDHAVVVVGAMKADLLADLRDQITMMLAEGQGIGEFRKGFAEIVARNGWEGWTGSDTKAGRTWRTRVIYQTNVATSYAAGRWAQLNDPDLIKARPFWRYMHADGVANPRPLHLAWGQSRLTLPYDHPYWQTHYPPNGFGCHCYVIAVRGPKPGDATVPPVGWDALVSSTGELPGIDKGWGYAPGATAADPLALARIVAEKAAALPAKLSGAYLAEIRKGVEPGLWAEIENYMGAGK